ncbi:MAG: LysM peptidoglycan-binding domain-containing protein [Bacteroidetes bacterium]|nr:LysM peptidoglycan-binding domain-containing protein [Bacteroidota bacterium]
MFVRTFSRKTHSGPFIPAKAPIWVLFLLFGAVQPLAAQYNTTTIRSYVDEWWPVAVESMQEHGIPASISLAQGILESAAGTSELSRKSNNHFGIKCHKEWTGKKVYYDDDAPGECFRQYNDPADSWADHSEFLTSRDRYAGLFDLKSDDYEGWAHGLKKAGYATNPKYADLLIKLIRDYALDEYDRYDNRQLASARGRRKPGAPDTPGPAVSSEVFWFNRIPTVLAHDGEYPKDISARQDVPLVRLCDYNDFEPDYALTEGEKVFLKPKRRKATEKVHLSKAGESLRDIAQQHGVLLDVLARRNLVTEGFVPAAGQPIYLRSKAARPPKAAPAGSAKPDQARLATAGVGTSLPASSSTPVRPQVQASSQRPAPAIPVPAPTQASAPASTAASTAASASASAPAVATAKSPSPASTATPKAGAAQPGAKPAAQPAPAALALPMSQHTVAQGETLYSIARRYSVSVDQVRSWNQLPDNTIKIGQVLVVGK